jgi:hypothetical protein
VPSFAFFELPSEVVYLPLEFPDTSLNDLLAAIRRASGQETCTVVGVTVT